MVPESETQRLVTLAALDSSGGIIAVLGPPSGFHVLTWNEGAERITGFPADEVVGTNLWELLVEEEIPRAIRNQLMAPHLERSLNCEVKIRTKTGPGKWLSIALSPLTEDAEGNAYRSVVGLDITQAKASMDRWLHAALHDPLTGLPNRRLLMDRIEVALSREKRSRGRVAVFLVDIDGFKFVNDTLGHSVGDDVLVAVARALEHAVRPGDTLARIGGDEFVIICEGGISVSEIKKIGSRLRDAAAARAPIRRLSLSMGAVLVSASTEISPRDVLKLADDGMYQAKARGGGMLTLVDARGSKLARVSLEDRNLKMGQQQASSK